MNSFIRIWLGDPGFIRTTENDVRHTSPGRNVRHITLSLLSNDSFKLELLEEVINSAKWGVLYSTELLNVHAFVIV